VITKLFTVKAIRGLTNSLRRTIRTQLGHFTDKREISRTRRFADTLMKNDGMNEDLSNLNYDGTGLRLERNGWKIIYLSPRPKAKLDPGYVTAYWC